MFLTALQFVGGLVLLVVGAEALVRGASRLAARLGIPPLVVGLTVVAFGTSAPELAVSLRAALDGDAAVSLGNVVGSNIFNVLFILGASALVAPLVVQRQLIRFDVPLMVGVSVLVLLLALDGRIGPVEGAVLVGGLAAYTAFQVRQGRAGRADAEAAGPTGPVGGSVLLDGAFVGGGLGVLVLGAQWLVAAAVAAATALGVSDLVVGLTIVAAGTSLPEVAASLAAARKGETDLAVGNVVGSNVFNLLSVLGITALVAPGGVPVPEGALTFDLPVMAVAAFACLPVFFTGLTIARWEGGLFVAYYVGYTVLLVLDATAHDAHALLGWALGAFALPLTAVTLAVLVRRDVRRGRG